MEQKSHPSNQQPHQLTPAGGAPDDLSRSDSNIPEPRQESVDPAAPVTEQSKTPIETKTAKQSRPRPRIYSKTTASYWAARIRKPLNGRKQQAPFFWMEFQFGGRRFSFPLYSADKYTASAKAAKIYSDMCLLGMDETIKRYANPRPQKAPAPTHSPTQEEACETTLGEWIIAAEKVFTGEKKSFLSYARSARQIAKWIQENRKSAEAEKQLTTRQRKAAEAEARKCFSPKNALAFRRLIDVEPITIFNRSALQMWRKAFVERVGNDELLKKRARTSSNSILRQAKALFSQVILDTISRVKIPSPLPFEKCKFYPAEDMSYRSRIDSGALVRAAKTELSERDPEVYKVFLLALGGGLRRSEIDTLTYEQVDFANSMLRMHVTPEGRRKSKQSEANVPLDEMLIDELKKWQQTAKDKFVLDGPGIEEPKKWGRNYRCDETFKRTIAWLRTHGVDTLKPIHTLRKEAGSLVATEGGIQAAKQFLRHKSIEVTSAYYAYNKGNHTVDLGFLLDEDE